MYGVTTTDPNYFGIVIEDCPHGDLRKRLDNPSTNLSIEQKFQILKDIAEVNLYDSKSLSLTLIFPLYCHAHSHQSGKSAGDAFPLCQ